MIYHTYEVSIVCMNALRFFEIIACDAASAHADLRAAYGDDVEIVSTRII